MRKTLLAANWKMNITSSETDKYFLEFKNLLKGSEAPSDKAPELIFACSYLSLSRALKWSKELDFQVAAQNVHEAEKGAFTGEVSIPMLKELDLAWVILGHSERRQYFNETSETVAKKALASVEAGLKVIACVGETKEERQAGQSEERVKEQLAPLLSLGLDSNKLVIAYEPVWAIGTGEAASSFDAQSMHEMIRKEIAKHSSESEALKFRVLYGGSMNEKNCKSFLEMADIDGGLVGGASLKPESFSKMKTLASEL